MEGGNTISFLDDDNNKVTVIATSAKVNGSLPTTLTPPFTSNAVTNFCNALSIFLVLPLSNAGRSSVRSYSSQSSVVAELTLCPESALSMPLPPNATTAGVVDAASP